MKTKILFGACRPLKEAQLLADAGFDFIEGSVPDFLKPTVDDEAFRSQLEALRSSPIQIRSCNGFIPGTFRLTGPEPTTEAALDFAETACRRADLADIKYIVFGSAGARNCPDGFSKDEAICQFTDFCRALAERIKDCKVTVVLEPLSPPEANFLNRVSEGLEIVKSVASPRIKLLADFYHMLCVGESAKSIEDAGDAILHCHIAEKEGRLFPGCSGEDFSSFFEALRKIGYAGGVSCEGAWKDVKSDLPVAIEYMKKY